MDPEVIKTAFLSAIIDKVPPPAAIESEAKRYFGDRLVLIAKNQEYSLPSQDPNYFSAFKVHQSREILLSRIREKNPNVY